MLAGAPLEDGAKDSEYTKYENEVLGSAVANHGQAVAGDEACAGDGGSDNNHWFDEPGGEYAGHYADGDGNNRQNPGWIGCAESVNDCQRKGGGDSNEDGEFFNSHTKHG